MEVKLEHPSLEEPITLTLTVTLQPPVIKKQPKPSDGVVNLSDQIKRKSFTIKNGDKPIDVLRVSDVLELLGLGDNQVLSVPEMERLCIEAALKRHGYKRNLAAADLQISERTLYRKLKTYGVKG